jgi:hypothetical protein
MKKIIVLLALISGIQFSDAQARAHRSSSSDVHVKSYTRSNGTYVNPHYRSAPDGIKSNNYGCIDHGNC